MKKLLLEIKTLPPHIKLYLALLRLVATIAVIIVLSAGIYGLISGVGWIALPFTATVGLSIGIVGGFLIIAFGYVVIAGSMGLWKDRREQQQRERKGRLARKKWESEARSLGWEPPRTKAESYRNEYRDWLNADHLIPYEPKAYYEWLDRQYKESPRFLWIVPLMAYGRLDVIGDAIELMPEWDPTIYTSYHDIGGVYRAMISQLLDMLPLPTNLQDDIVVVRNKEALRTWYREHKDRLTWNEELAQFTFDVRTGEG